MKFAFRMAWREARASKGRFVFVVLAVAAGVAALSGVKGFNESVRYTLLAEARTLMGADLVVRLQVDPTDEELAFLDSLSERGIDYTPVTETVSMSSSLLSGQDSPPLLSSIKSADLSKYPYYGELVFDPPSPDLADDSVVVSGDLLLRLGIEVGDMVQVGGGRFTIAAVALSEPDRMTTGFTLGPRVLMTHGGYEAAGLNVPGSRATQRLLVRLPEATDLNSVRREISEVFGRRARVSDYTEENRTLSRGLGRATTFLSLVSLIALIVGGLGVATSIEGHLKQKMDSIAMIKCLGGTSRQVMQIYLAQSLMLGLAGSVLGVIFGFGAQLVFPQFLVAYFDVDVQLIVSAAPIFQGVLAGLLTALLFTIPPLLSIAEIRPALIFRRDMNESAPTIPNWKPYGAFGVIALGLWGMAIWIGDSFEVGSIFAAGLIGSVLLLAAVGQGMLVVIRRVNIRFGSHWNPALRHGIANLYRPGSHMIAILAALGIGVMFTLSVHLLQTTLVDQLRTSAPPDMPNVYMINITNQDREGLWELLENQAGVIAAPPAAPAVSALLHTVKGVPIEDMGFVPGQRRYLRTQFQLTWSADEPPATEILEGEWWESETGEALVSVEENAAGILDLSPGDELEWTIGGRVTGARVANIRRTDGTRAGANNQFVLTPGSLDDFPGIYFGALRVEPEQVGALQRTVFERYPAVTVVNAADIVDIVQEMVGEISLVVRFVAGFAILGGLIILASSVAGTRYRRIREAAILKTVGARRSRIISIFSIEFLILGLVAGFIGAFLAAAFTALIVYQLMDGTYQVDVVPLVFAVALTAVLAVVTGWAASYRILGQKPLEVLRRADA
jgi:putative ABC transport system permease protein